MNEENESHLKSIVLRLGGLHTAMSYLGTMVGHRMQNTGLNEALEIVLEIFEIQRKDRPRLETKATSLNLKIKQKKTNNNFEENSHPCHVGIL